MHHHIPHNVSMPIDCFEKLSSIRVRLISRGRRVFLETGLNHIHQLTPSQFVSRVHRSDDIMKHAFTL